MKINIRRHHITSPLLAVAVGGIVFLAFVTVMSAYGGMVNPEYFPAMALLNMAFPIVAIANLVALVILGIARSRLALVPALAVLLTLGPALNFAPVNIRKPLTPEQKKDSFTLLTFNCLHWDDYDNPEVPEVPNPSVQYVLDTDADIVCLQESAPVSVSVRRGITPAQRDSMDRRYPYRVVESIFPGLSLYSKYPITRVVLQDSICGSAVAQAYRVSISGHLLTLINVHLQSLMLTPQDKALYKEMTRANGTGSDMSKMRDQVFSKLYDAFAFRTVQARFIRDVIDSRPGNTIVCGDFNDVPGCYAVRTIMDGDMHDAYADAALGPTFTYNKNRFYFRIDQVLYRGTLQCVDLKRGTDVISDHYPLLATFLWNDK